jgi:hypothetical protein
MVEASMTDINTNDREAPTGQFRAVRNWVTM